jgi:hypothetical protein
VKSIKINPPYKPLVQEKYLCTPCCIQWVLFRHGSWVEQQEIARALKTVIPKKYKRLFPKDFPTTKNKKLYGTPSYGKEGMKYFENIFKKYKIPMTVKYISIKEVKEPEKFISENLKKGNDIVLGYYQRAIKKFKVWNDSAPGHAVLVSEIKFGKKTRIVLGDPSSDHPRFWEVDLKELIAAMQDRRDPYKRGFWVFKKKVIK